jgi:two-component system chemotaxis sensor kinase CheA
MIGEVEFMNMDMSQYLDVFLEESKEHLVNLNEKLLELEKNPQDLSSLNEIFRAAHTLKGMSSTMGFNDMADLTHHMEDVLSELKEGLIRVESAVIDILFDCFDRLQIMVGNIQSGQSPVNNTDLIEMLNKVKQGTLTTPSPQAVTDLTGISKEQASAISEQSSIMPFKFNQYDLTVLREVQTRGLNAYYVSINVAPDCLMKSVRSFMVFKTLEADGEVIKTCPSAQELDEGRFDDQFHLVLVNSLDEETIRQRIEAISEVEVDVIQLINLDDLYDLNHEVPGEISPKNFRSTEIVSTPDKLSEEGTRSHKVKQTVRVDIERLDNLMNLVGELVISKGQLEQIGLTQHHTDLNDVIEQLERITNDLQSVVMNVRMVPIEQVFNRFPRMVRDLAKELGKDIEFIIEGKETELDRTVIDEIGDPLVHLLRNAVDHGIEYPQIRRQNGKPSTGLVRLVARHEGNNVFIEVTDDGGGFDLETIRAKALEKGLASPQDLSSMTPGQVTDLLFRPGFSTAQNVTDVSGRGVGLDVVKNKIESLNGEIQVDTVLGQGTTFKIRLPLTLAIIQALLVKVGNETFAIPLSSVDETTMIKKSDLKMIQSQEVVVLRGKVLPLVYARRLLESPEQGIAEEEMYVVVVRKGDKQLGIIVDSLIGQQEIVIKSLGKLLIGIPGVAGATILGDGAVSLILDVGTLV